MLTADVSRIRATSCATDEKTSAGAAPSATKVATLRSAACSATTRRRLSRDSVLEIAVATSWVKSRRLASMSARSGSGPVAAARISPQTSPSTTIGTPTSDRSSDSARAGRPVSRTLAERLRPSSGNRPPTGKSEAFSEASTTVDLSAS
jgi:hypothetical protein